MEKIKNINKEMESRFGNDYLNVHDKMWKKDNEINKALLKIDGLHLSKAGNTVCL